jgi:tight adherence protein C
MVMGVRFWIRPKAALDRLLNTSEPVAKPRQPLHAQVRRILDAAGSRIGNRAKERELVVQLLARAGFRKSGAVNIYNGARLVASVFFCAIAAAAAMLRGAEFSTTIMLAIGGLGAGFLLPTEFLRMLVRRRKKAIEHALPNTLDLLTICVESGLGLDQGILHVARELGRAHPEMGQELSLINLETRAGISRPEALRSMAARTSVQDVKELVAVLIQADRFGTSIAQTLRTYSSHLRVQARQRAEEKAATLSVKLVFPIFFFILPSLFVITVGPVVVRIVCDLLPMMNSI